VNLISHIFRNDGVGSSILFCGTSFFNEISMLQVSGVEKVAHCLVCYNR